MSIKLPKPWARLPISLKLVLFFSFMLLEGMSFSEIKTKEHRNYWQVKILNSFTFIVLFVAVTFILGIGPFSSFKKLKGKSNGCLA